MKRTVLAIVATALLASAAERKPLPGQAGNDDIELVASALVDRDEIQQALGGDLGDGYVVVRMKATPKTDHSLRIGPDDFTALSRKDGQRSVALLPSQIAGNGGALVVKQGGRQGGGVGTQRRPSWGLGGGGAGVGNAPSVDGAVETKVEQVDNKTKDNPLLAVLKEKALPDKETQAPVEGLLFFPIEGKLKPKDLAVIYKGPAGKLVIEFANPKGGR